ncbi:MAG TPA: hypothetical protein VFO01_05300 [Trebonia sp.]|nr:hypothetical protein [Trebonia sp.]
MRYKAIFIAGVAVGFVAGARAGRGVYDKMAGYGKQVASHPKVQQAASTAQAKATKMAKTAAAKAPDYAKSAATSAAKTAQSQVSHVPKYVSSARQAAAGKRPARFGGSGGKATSGDPATDGTAATRVEDDITPDGSLIYPAEGSPSVNNTLRHYTPGTPETGD